MAVKQNRIEFMKIFIKARIINDFVKYSSTLHNNNGDLLRFIEEKDYIALIGSVVDSVEDYLREHFWDKEQIEEEE